MDDEAPLVLASVTISTAAGQVPEAYAIPKAASLDKAAFSPESKIIALVTAQPGV